MVHLSDQVIEVIVLTDKNYSFGNLGFYYSVYSHTFMYLNICIEKSPHYSSMSLQFITNITYKSVYKLNLYETNYWTVLYQNKIFSGNKKGKPFVIKIERSRTK